MAEENKKILLNSSRSKLSVNKDSLLDIAIDSSEKKLPADDINEVINEYQQYIKEKDGSNKYRLVFTINPMCSNVLFNRITEIVKDEGSDKAAFFGVEGQIGSINGEFNSQYFSLKKWNEKDKSTITRKRLIKDTTLSHPEAAKENGLTYLCGYDIFSNHYFRNLETVLINRVNASYIKENNQFIKNRRKIVGGFIGTQFNTENLTTNIGGIWNENNAIENININNPVETSNSVTETNSSTVDFSKFNELGDYARDYDGSVITTLNGTDNTETPTHIFFRNTTRSFTESISNGLIERDGWFGFKNPTKMEIANFSFNDETNTTEGIHTNTNSRLTITINKAINNVNGNEFVDMYPGRKLYSFIPNVNKYRKRVESNWDYCITYPYENYTDNELVSFVSDDDETTINGLKCEFTDSNGVTINNINVLIYGTETTGDTTDNVEYRDVFLRTLLRNNIKNGSDLYLHLVVELNDGTTRYNISKTPIKVKNVGLDGYGTNYYFSISISDIMSGLLTLKGNKNGAISNVYCYAQRIEDGSACKYYFRKFKRLPNFKNTEVNNVNVPTKEDINKYCLSDFSSSLNKLGFGENIYGDRMAQIVIDDDLDTTNLFDNLGRPITELYLTVVKTNRGNDIWYKDDGNGYMEENINGVTSNFAKPEVEYSHCFSEITSGVEMPWVRFKENGQLGQYDYNVHGLHNLPTSGIGAVGTTISLYPTSSKPLEKNITVSGTSISEEKGEFLGDVCELNENTLDETVIDNVYHRFNTVQRETTKLYNEFGALVYDELESDDLDGEFEIKEYIYGGKSFLDNIAPEGYYYKPHYRINVREYDDTVHEGYHTRLEFDSLSKLGTTTGGTDIYYGVTDRNYYLEKGNTLYIFDKNSGKKYIGVVTNAGGDEYRNVTFEAHTDTELKRGDFIFYKPNILKPSNAYDINNGSGRYVWRTLKSAINVPNSSELYDSVFTNGAHYFHKNINFFLRRQDPFGDFWLNGLQNPNVPDYYTIFDTYGNETDVTNVSYFNEGETGLC